MSIWNKILLGFIAVAAIAFFYLGARALKTHDHWRTAIAKHEKALAEELAKADKLAGTAGEEADLKQSLRQLKLDLHKLHLNRPRVWNDVKPQKVDQAKDDKGRNVVEVSVTIDSPSPHLIEKDFDLWLFEKKDAEEGGRYLGEFLVSAVTDKQVQLRPAKPLRDWQVERLRGSLGPWLICEHPPVDVYDAFENVPDMSKLLPAASLAEYTAKPKADGAKDGERTIRPLRDYEVILGTFYNAYAAWKDQMEAMRRDAAAVKQDLETVTSEVALREKEIGTLKEDLATETRKRDVMAAHLKALQVKLADVLGKIAELARNNRALAAAIATIQKAATSRIDAQTRKMATATGSP